MGDHLTSHWYPEILRFLPRDHRPPPRLYMLHSWDWHFQSSRKQKPHRTSLPCAQSEISYNGTLCSSNLLRPSLQMSRAMQGLSCCLPELVPTVEEPHSLMSGVLLIVEESLPQCSSASDLGQSLDFVFIYSWGTLNTELVVRTITCDSANK